ncbi:MAG: MBL fold metallo-hydrolase [Flavobacteriales bacterium]|nr:MAG: MBL fold metallo-hydrolase [Flavobacteriales bacterium]
MTIYPVHAGHFKLDGGAMFGVVPKKLWQKANQPDEQNMCSWAARCMLIEDGDRLILIDTGMGDKQDEKFFGHYHLHGPHSLDNSLKDLGFTRNDITDVFLTHLHFDHCGGAIRWNKNRTGYEPAFPNAHFWSNQRHWQWATQPNPREKASFLKENILPLEESGQLKFIDLHNDGLHDTPLPFQVYAVSGHTEAQMLPVIEYQGQKIVFMADLLPSAGHVPLPWVMAYDTRPLLTMKEKEQFLHMAAEEEFLLYFEHDPVNDLGRVEHTERGVRLKSTHSFHEIFQK